VRAECSHQHQWIAEKSQDRPGADRNWHLRARSRKNHAATVYFDSSDSAYTQAECACLKLFSISLLARTPRPTALAIRLPTTVRSAVPLKAKMQEHEPPEILTSRSRPVAAGAGGVVLLVDDEVQIRKLVRTILEANGCVVIDACNGLEGLALCQRYPGRIDLLLSDIVMPELGGRELAEVALKLRPGLRILFMSGYSEEMVEGSGTSSGDGFLHKPFTPSALVQKVRETIAKHERRAAPGFVAGPAPPESEKDRS